MSEMTEKHTITDVGAGLVKAIIQTNPITGFVQTIYDEFAACQWQQRREKWEETFERKLQDIKDDVDFQKITSISNFAQILANATQGAMSDIEEDKVGLYANTVINAIKNENIDNTKTHIFLNMLRKYSKMHIDILKECLVTHCSTVDTILDDIFCKRTNYVPENKIHPIRLIDRRFHTLDMRYQIIAELYNDNLFDVYIDNSRIHPHASSGINKELSSLAVEFLAFITEQEAKNA